MTTEEWNSPIEISIFPEMSYGELMSNNGIKTWLEHIQRAGFVLVTNTPETAEATKELMEKIA